MLSQAVGLAVEYKNIMFPAVDLSVVALSVWEWGLDYLSQVVSKADSGLSVVSFSRLNQSH